MLKGELTNIHHTLTFLSVINPFNQELKFDIIVQQNGAADVELIDGSGKIVRKNKMFVTAGVNHLEISNTGIFSPGIYTLRVHTGDMFIFKRVMKQNK